MKKNKKQLREEKLLQEMEAAETEAQEADESNEAADSKAPAKKNKKKQHKPMSKRMRYGSMSTVILVVFLAVVIVINVLVSVIIDRFPLTIDLTDDSIYGLTDDSIEYLSTLDKDVTIYVLSDESTFQTSGTYYLQAYETLKQYRQYSSHITLEFMDYYSNPQLATTYSDYDLADGDVIVECGDRTRHYALEDLFEITYDYTTYESTVESSNVEESITSAIMQVTDANPVKVIVLTGHGETEPTTLMDLLTTNGYEIITQNIMTDELDDEASIIIISEPTEDYNTAELEKLDAFLNQSGTYGRQLMVIAGTVYSDMPKLDEFLEEWGLSIDSGYLYETDSSLTYGSNYLFLDYLDSDTEYLTDDADVSYPILSMYTHPITLLFSERGSYATEALLYSSDSCVLQPVEDVEDEDWDSSTATQQSYVEIALSTKTTYDEIEEYSSSVIVVGSDEIFGDYSLEMEAVNNAELALGLFAELTGKESGITILSKSFLGTSIGISDAWVARFMVFFVVIVPVGVLVAATIVYFRRRHR